MNKIPGKKEKGFLNGKKDLALFCVIAVALFLAAFVVFGKEENIQGIGVAQMSEKEQKVCQILQEIEGVGEASVKKMKTRVKVWLSYVRAQTIFVL